MFGRVLRTKTSLSSTLWTLRMRVVIVITYVLHIFFPTFLPNFNCKANLKIIVVSTINITGAENVTNAKKEYRIKLSF